MKPSSDMTRDELMAVACSPNASVRRWRECRYECLMHDLATLYEMSQKETRDDYLDAIMTAICAIESDREELR